MQLPCHLVPQAVQSEHLLCLQACLMRRLVPTLANWLRTCSRRGTMRLTPIWAASHHSSKWEEGLVEQQHVQDWAAALVAGNHQQSHVGQQLPQRHWQGSLPLQQSGSQPPRGGSRVGLGGQWGKYTRDCESKQQYQSRPEVQPLWAQMERHCV